MMAVPRESSCLIWFKNNSLMKQRYCRLALDLADSGVTLYQFDREKSAYWQGRYKAFTPAEIDAILQRR